MLRTLNAHYVRYVKFEVTASHSFESHSIQPNPLTDNRLAFEHNQFDIKYIIISKLMNKLTDYYDGLSDFNERIY